MTFYHLTRFQYKRGFVQRRYAIRWRCLRKAYATGLRERKPASYCLFRTVLADIIRLSLPGVCLAVIAASRNPFLRCVNLILRSRRNAVSLGRLKRLISRVIVNFETRLWRQYDAYLLVIFPLLYRFHWGEDEAYEMGFFWMSPSIKFWLSVLTGYSISFIKLETHVLTT